jgi:glycosyltransferase involved in cell wall biosynthesis
MPDFMRKNKISVIIPTFNRVELLEATLQSIQRQTSPDWEAIVVDDGSSDGSDELVRSMSETDSRIKLIRRDRSPKGASTCRNIGLLKASFEYVIFLDSDDLMLPDCIKHRLEAVNENPDKDFLVFQIASFTSTPEKPECLWNVDNNEDDLHRFLKLDSVWQTSSVVWRKEAVLLLGGFDVRLHCWQDVDLHVRALMAGPKYEKFLDSSPDILYRRQNQSSISQQQIHSREKLQSRKLILEKAHYMADGRPWMIRELRWMASSIIASAANGHRFNNAYYILAGAWTRKIFNKREVLDLIKLLLVHQFRLERIPTGRKLKQRITGRIIWQDNICKIPVTQ